MQALLKPLLELAEYEDIVKKKKEAPGVLMLTGCVNSQKTHMMSHLAMAVVIKSSPVPVRQKRNRFMKSIVF